MAAFGDIVEARTELIAAQEAAASGEQSDSTARARDRAVPRRRRRRASSTRSLRSPPSLVSVGRPRGPSPALRRSAGGLTSASCWPSSPTCCCSTSLPTTSTSTPSRGSRAGSLVPRRRPHRLPRPRLPRRNVPDDARARTRGLRVYPFATATTPSSARSTSNGTRAVVERQQAYIEKTTRSSSARTPPDRRPTRPRAAARCSRGSREIEQPEDVWAVAEKIAFRFAGFALGRHRPDASALAAKRGAAALRSRRPPRSARRAHRRRRPNGSGKSTLLKLLADRGAPEDRATFAAAPTSRIGYYDQHLGEVDPRRTAPSRRSAAFAATQRRGGPDVPRAVSLLRGQRAPRGRRLLRRRARASRSRSSSSSRRTSFLDEPTNHLDIPAAEILEEAPMGFWKAPSSGEPRPALPREHHRHARGQRPRRPRRHLQRRRLRDFAPPTTSLGPRSHP